jgi:hypothetical protein
MPLTWEMRHRRSYGRSAARATSSSHEPHDEPLINKTELMFVLPDPKVTCPEIESFAAS